MPSVKMTINLPDSIRQQLKLSPWGNRPATGAICKTIDRYNLILNPEKKQVKEMFSLAEMNLFFELCKKNNFIPAEKCKDGIIEAVAEAPEEFFSNGLEKNKIIEKLKQLSIIENVALVEVLEDLEDLAEK